MAVKSRGRYSTRAKKKRTRVEILIALGLVFFLFKWGLPLFVKLVAKTGGSAWTESVGDEDTIPPQRPVIAATPEATYSGQIKVEGYTEAEVEITYWLNGELFDTGASDREGAFSDLITLEEGENTISVKAKDEAGNESESQGKVVILDKEAPVISVESPSDGAEFFGSHNERVSVKGTVSETEVNLVVNGAYVSVKSDGSFETSFLMAEGENQIEITATDRAGNVDKQTLTVKYVR